MVIRLARLTATDDAFGVYVLYDLSGSVSGNTFSSIVKQRMVMPVGFMLMRISIGIVVSLTIRLMFSQHGIGQNTIGVGDANTNTMYLTGITNNTFNVTADNTNKEGVWVWLC